MTEPAKALAWAGEQLDGMTQLLEEVVLINSHTANKPGVDAVGRVFKQELVKLGLAVETIAQPGHGDLLVAATPAAGESGNIMLCGHMDTVFPIESGFNWFKSEGDKCFGPGVADMKGGLVVALFALKHLAEEGVLNDMPIRFMLNSEEETGSPVSGPVIEDLAAGCLAALVFECGGKKGEVVTGRKGKLGLRLEIKGRAGHAGYPGAIKASALLELAHKIIALEGLNGLAPGLTLNVGKASGGSGANVVPEKAEALIDVRLPDAEAERDLLKEVERITGQVQIVGVSSRIERTSGRPPMPVSRGNQALYNKLSQVAAGAGIEIADEYRGGVSDANYIASQNTPVLDGLGPVGGNDHSDKEYIDRQSLASRVAVTSLLLNRLARDFAAGNILK
jgi:glutamate carboxypeptidase